MEKHTKVYRIAITVYLAIVLFITIASNYISFFEIYQDPFLCYSLSVFAMISAVELLRTKPRKTDGDLLAGIEDEDGLVISLDVPVEELANKDFVTFKVVRTKMEVKDQHE